ncbi:hypothetical protein [Azospirillum halopraeferens]|uniref:hypothetical protein n=1 Tax=Azospirillum halopraeferens TaxID=34010 RepID=UPI0012EB1182|nr:hypothetical protein [Azospirillum halopraeferens]
MSWPTSRPSVPPPASAPVPAREPAAPRLPARRLRHAHEAHDAVRAADLLRRPLTLDSARTLLTALEPYRRRVHLPAGDSALHALVGQSPARLQEMTLRHASPVLVDVLLPACREHLNDRLFGPLAAAQGAPEPAEIEGLPSALDIAAAMRTLLIVLRGAGRAHTVAVLAALEEQSRTLARTVVRADRPVGRPGGVAELSHALLRLEGFRLVMEALGAGDGPLAEVASECRRVARLALRHCAATLDGFVRSRSLMTLHDSLTVIASVDSLIVLAMRMLDSLQDREEETSPFVRTADAEALDGYVEAATRLGHAVLDLLHTALPEPRFDNLLFVALARKVKWLHRFTSRLGVGHPHRPPALDTLSDFLVARSEALARRTASLLETARDHRPADAKSADDLLARADEVAHLMRALDRPAAANILTTRAAAVRGAPERVA